MLPDEQSIDRQTNLPKKPSFSLSLLLLHRPASKSDLRERGEAMELLKVMVLGREGRERERERERERKGNSAALPPSPREQGRGKDCKGRRDRDRILSLLLQSRSGSRGQNQPKQPTADGEGDADLDTRRQQHACMISGIEPGGGGGRLFPERGGNRKRFTSKFRNSKEKDFSPQRGNGAAKNFVL